jgi:hypothetical protein
MASWQAAWPQALASWSAYTQLRAPIFYADDREAEASGMAGQIAAIRLSDQTVMVNLEQVRQLQIEDHALAVLAHEIGHHVYVPGNLSDNARMFAAMQPILFGLPKQAVHFAANLYGDLMINDRLQRRAGVDVAAVYRYLNQKVERETSETWRVYTRTYEHLWLLPEGTLAPPPISPEMNADALLIARLVRHYAGRWLGGARRFACVLYPYLQADEEKKATQTFICLGLCDCQKAGGDALPDGLSEIDPAELGEDESFDKELAGVGEDDSPDSSAKGRRKKKAPREADNTEPDREGKGRPGKQFREPFEYGELLKALGLDLSEHEITTRYYRERALPHLIPYPARRPGRSKEPLAEGYDTWETDEEIDKLDLFGSLLRSPEMVPGVTTLQRVYGEAPGSDPAPVPLDLDIYVDCSGSMPNPAVNVSYLALAGTILALSALRAGANVQATLWSGAGQFETTGGFVRDEKGILGTITGYISGGTAFPLNVLRDTYANRRTSDPPAHIVIISDDGADTILMDDEKGTAGADVCVLALGKARGGGTMVLNLPQPDNWKAREQLQQLGFRIHPVTDWEQLVAFARAFVRENYQPRSDSSRG